MGIKISRAPAPYSLTTVVYIVPRYILINNLNYPIEIREAGEKSAGSLPENSQIIPPGERLNYMFMENTSYKSIKIRDYSESQEDSKRWSSGFPIEDIEDFHVKFRSREHPENIQAGDPGIFQEWEGEDDIALPELQETVPEGEKWFMPTALNNYLHFIRVCINSPDEASIFVIFGEPSTYICNIYIYIYIYRIPPIYFEERDKISDWVRAREK